MLTNFTISFLMIPNHPLDVLCEIMISFIVYRNDFVTVKELCSVRPG